MKTKAAVVYEHNAPVVVETLEIADPKADEVLIRMKASGVCHSDLSVITGTIYYNPPVVIGHEGAGIVERVGENVTYVKSGDHVVLSFVTQCGKCHHCAEDRPILCDGVTTKPGHLLDNTCRLRNQKSEPIPQMARIGTMSEFAVVPIQNVVKIEPKYDLEKAALVGCAVTTGLGAVSNTAKVKKGSSVAVIGAGGVGLNVMQGAKLAEADRIFAIDLVQNKLNFAKDFGATDLINSSETDPITAIHELTNGRGVDYAFEVIGNLTTIDLAYAITRSRGTVIIVGMASPKDRISFPAQSFVRNEKRLIGSFYGSSIPRIDMPKILDWSENGKIEIDRLITKIYALDEINTAFDDMKLGVNARGVIRFG